MPSFKDKSGNEWLIALDAINIQATRDKVEVDLAGQAEVLFPKLGKDPVLLLRVLWELCREQAAPGITEFAVFVKGFGGDQIEAATDCLVKAYLDFSPPSKRRLLDAQIKIDETLRGEVIDEAIAKIQDPALAARIKGKLLEKLDIALDEILNEPETMTQSYSATNAPALSESVSGA